MFHIIKPNSGAKQSMCGQRFSNRIIDFMTMSMVRRMDDTEKQTVCPECLKAFNEVLRTEATLVMDESPRCSGGPDCDEGRAWATKQMAMGTLYVRLLGSKCKWDNEPLTPNGVVVLHGYEHDSGWAVERHAHKLWLSLTCPKCGYEWSINKLGVSR